MRNIKLAIEYEGTNFRGWQIQARGQRTVQGEIEKALRKIFGQRIHLIGSGRTDSGVHALGQVANFHVDSPMPTTTMVRALNANLPQDIVIHSAKEVAAKFHSQFSAKKKTYRYTIINRQERACLERDFVFYHPALLNVKKMRQAAKLIRGRHDFRSFMASDTAVPKNGTKNTIRNISRLTIRKSGDKIFIDIESNGFLYKMVRNIVGTLLGIGEGKLKPDQMLKILKAQDRSVAPATAPAHGLCMMKVTY